MGRDFLSCQFDAFVVVRRTNSVSEMKTLVSHGLFDEEHNMNL